MSLYRIACVFEKSHPRMSGKSAGSAHIKRGVWRVFDCWAMPHASATYCVDGDDGADRALLITGTKWMRVGTLCNPRRILAEYQRQRNLCRVVERVAADPVIGGNV